MECDADVQQLKQWVEELYDCIAETHSLVMQDDFESASLAWQQSAGLAPRVKLRLGVLAKKQLNKEGLM